MTNLVISPLAPFADIDGSPLNEGFIFIGEKDKDPIQYPIAVYWDEAKTQPAAQPIRTRNGFVVNGLDFSKIYIDKSSCSILVKNRYQSNIYSVQNAPQFTSVASSESLVQVESTRAMAAETALSTAITNEATRATTAETLLQTQINTNGVGNRAYLTYADMVADAINITAKSKVTVTNDSDSTKNGDYQYDGAVFTKSNYDILTQAKDYTDNTLADGYIKNYTNEILLLDDKPSVLEMRGRADDTRKIYQWNRTSAVGVTPVTGTWTDTGLSDLDLAKNFTLEQLKTIAAVNVHGEAIIQVEDASGKITMKQTADGHLHLPHLQKSVQENIKEITGFVSAEKSENLIELYDDNANMVLRQSSDGDLHWAGSEQSLNQRLNSSSQDNDLLQIKDENEETVLVKIDNTGDFVNSQIPEGYGKRLNSSFLSPKSNYIEKSKRFLIREDALHVINSSRALISSISAPVPLDQVPLNYTPPQTILNLTVSQPQPSTLDSTYRKNDGFVHPHLVQFYTNLNGFKYWLAITSYKETVDYAENAFVFGSNDLKQFHLFDDFPQPLAEKPAQVIEKSHTYNSDPFHFYDFQSCELCIGWRVTYQVPNEARLHIGLMFKSTKDGKHWSDIRTLMPVSGDNEKLLSPTIIYDFVNHKYLMYAVDPVDNYSGRKEIVRYECSYLGDAWVNRTLIASPREFTPWHLEARYLGDSIALLVHDIYVNKNLFLGLSSDNGNTFNFGGAILNGGLETYKATFTPLVNEQNNTISLNYVWNSNHFNKDDPTQQWLTFSQKTQSVTL